MEKKKKIKVICMDRLINAGFRIDNNLYELIASSLEEA
jgi:predicted nucleic acid-binding protein